MSNGVDAGIYFMELDFRQPAWEKHQDAYGKLEE